MAHKLTSADIFRVGQSSAPRTIVTGGADVVQLSTNTAEFNLIALAASLDLTMSEEEILAEFDYICENRRNYYKTHKYMKKLSLGTSHDGPVFPGDTLYRMSTCDKFIVNEDGSLTTKSGGVHVKRPDYTKFSHTRPPKNFGLLRKDKGPAPQAEPEPAPAPDVNLKTRTEIEESLAAAKEREILAKKDKEAKAIAQSLSRARKEAIIKEHLDSQCAAGACAHTRNGETCPVWDALEQIPVADILKHVSDEDLARELVLRQEPGKPGIPIGLYPDDVLAAELRRRGYTLTATKDL